LDTVVFLKNREVIFEKPNSVTKTIQLGKGSERNQIFTNGISLPFCQFQHSSLPVHSGGDFAQNDCHPASSADFICYNVK